MENIRKEYRSLVKACNTAEDKARKFEKQAMDENGRVFCEQSFLDWVAAMEDYNNLAYKIDALSNEIFIKE